MSGIDSREVREMDDVVRAVRQGEGVIICDHPDRENEGDFFIAAEKITVPILNIFIQRGRGLVCCPLTQAIATRLELGPQVAHNTSLYNTQFTVSIDSAHCEGSGIPSVDRVLTITSIANPRTTPRDFVRPGHLFPIVSHPEGIVGRSGHTEAAIALLTLAGLAPVGAICEIVGDNGEMAGTGELQRLASELGMKLVEVDHIREYYMSKMRG